jgi:hypothetical protein
MADLKDKFEEYIQSSNLCDHFDAEELDASGQIIEWYDDDEESRSDWKTAK